jgi:hypothetical protein
VVTATGEDEEPVRRLLDAVRRTVAVTTGRSPSGLGHDDAPDDAGTVATDDAVGFDPFPLLARLDAAGAPVVVIGQVAGILHGSVELTGDLDLLWDGDPRHAPALAEAFGRAGATLTDDDGAELPCTPDAFERPKVQFRSPSASGDCCTPQLPWGDLPVAAFLDRAVSTRTADGGTVRYLDAADLVAMRRASGRPRDLRRADELERLIAASTATPRPAAT